jgi:hypothetical protein
VEAHEGNADLRQISPTFDAAMTSSRHDFITP